MPHIVRFKKKVILIERDGATLCTRTPHFKVCHETPGSAWDAADCVYEKDEQVLFVYQCLPYHTWHGDGKHVVINKYNGCGYFHVTKQIPTYGGAYRIGYWFASQPQEDSIAQMVGSGRLHQKAFYPPAPLKEF